MSVPSRTVRTMSAETAHFRLRTLRVADANENWCEWLMDPRAQANLNAPPRRLTIDELRAYVASFDGVSSHIVGIFEKQSGQLVGVRNAYVDYVRSQAVLNTLVGEVSARNKGAQHESRYAMHNFVFEDLDIQTLRATVVSTNAYMLGLLASTGWELQGKSLKPRVSGHGNIELHQFRLTREAWRSKFGAIAYARAMALDRPS
jgi:RimJ/RimL family protein N-acetyltransferase